MYGCLYSSHIVMPTAHPHGWLHYLIPSGMLATIQHFFKTEEHKSGNQQHIPTENRRARGRCERFPNTD